MWQIASLVLLFFSFSAASVWLKRAEGIAMNSAILLLSIVAVLMLGVAWYADTHRSDEQRPKGKK